MNLTISFSWPFLTAFVVTLVVWIWALTRPVNNFGPDPTPIFYGGVAITVTLSAWLIYFAARVQFGF